MKPTNKLVLSTAALLLLLFGGLVSGASAAVTGATSNGWTIFTRDSNASADYRYGPAIIINSDGSIDMWTSSPPVTAGSWDTIRYRRSTDGGHTWTSDVIALQPTAGSDDALSTCDPGVIKFGGYYYIGYTSTLGTSLGGTNNEVYVARSANPAGPYEKWNGSGWGGAPKAFIKYTGSDIYDYGAGEPSFTIKGNTLYVYYTWFGRDSSTTVMHNETRVATVDIGPSGTSDPNWPAHLTYHAAPAIERGKSWDMDSTDHKYVPAWDKFIAVESADRMSASSYIRIFESDDGLTYRLATLPKNDIKIGAHNAGISGNEKGQFDPSNPLNFISYAYGYTDSHNLKFGWSTAVNPITLSNNGLPAMPRLRAVHAANQSAVVYFDAAGGAGETYTIKYGTARGVYDHTVTGVAGSPATVTGLQNGVAYYFAVAAVNAAGSSANSNEGSATPLAYSAIPLSVYQYSSQLSGWEASKAVDGNTNTAWSSMMFTSPDDSSSPQYIALDAGQARYFGRVAVTPRQPSGYGWPEHARLQISTDGVTWSAADTKEPYQIGAIAAPTLVYEFTQPTYARYVRYDSGGLGRDSYNNYYMQLAEIAAEQVPFALSSSSATPGWEPYKAIDGNPGSVFSSQSHTAAASTETLTLNLGTGRNVTGVMLTPRPEGGFPVDFKFRYSLDGVNFYDIPGASYTGYPNPGGASQYFAFSAPVLTQHIQLYASKLSPDSYGNYYLQIGEMRTQYHAARAVSAATSLTGWEAAHLVDNNPGNAWSSQYHASAAATESVTVDMGSVKNWSELDLLPRTDGSGNTVAFPVDFSIAYSVDGSTWTTLPSMSFTDYIKPYQGELQKFPFQSLVSARYFKITATKLNHDGTPGYYYFQMSEVYVK